MSTRFETVTIIGVGLLGASLGLALKSRGLATCVRGVGRTQESLDRARALGAIDEVHTDLRDAASNADLIVICTPAASVPEYLDALRPLCAKSTVVTDVASTKGVICTHAKQAWAEPYRFVGSHPMAGSEKYGPEHAEADLFDGSVCFVERNCGHATDAHAAVLALWEQVGARGVEIDPEEHDAIVARTSHVPHIVAAALTQILKDRTDVGAFIGSGYRDTTRVAEGRPELWRDIAMTNAAAIKEALREISERLDRVLAALDEENAAEVEAFFTAGRDARRRALDE